MLARAFVATLALVGLSACPRRLPQVHRSETAALVITPAFTTAAPSERVAFTTEGGVPPYTFALDAAGGSGNAATIDTEGRYVAGDDGPANDTVIVTDAAGTEARARVAVGSPLRITAAQSTVAPGGTVQLNVVGGKPPYTYSISTGDGGVDPNGLYHAGTLGARTDEVTVRDQSERGVAAVRLAIGAPVTLVVAGTTETAPLGEVTLVATGGAPPYAYDLATNTSLGTVDPISGHYRAGALGDVEDVARVIDSFGQASSVTITVTAALALAIDSEARPGHSYALRASGGRPQYRFAFARAGNHSAGSVAAIDGEYIPGDNALATDTLEVQDSNGARATLAVHVEPRIFEALGANKCDTADVDGDGHRELLLSAITASDTVTEVISFAPSHGAPLSQRQLRFSGSSASTVKDLLFLDADGDGADDVVVLHPRSITLYKSLPGGSLASPVSLFAPSTNGDAQITSFAYAAGAAKRTLYFSYFSSGVQDEPPCTTNDGGIGLVDFTTVAGSPQCAADVLTKNDARVTAVDLDSDTSPDVVYLPTLGSVAPPIPATIAGIRRGGPSLPPIPVPMPYAVLRSDALQGDSAFVAWLPGPAGVATLRLGSLGQSNYTALSCAASCTTLQASPVGGFATSVTNNSFVAAAALAPSASAPDRVLAFNAFDARDLRVTAGSVTTVPTALTLPSYPPSCLGAGDFDGDGITDLAIADAGGHVELRTGESDGTFARRLHVRDFGSNARSLDLDLDGDDDVAVIDGERRIAIYLQDAGELALTDRIELTIPPTSLEILSSPGGPRLLAFDTAMRAVSIALNADGRAAAPSVLASAGAGSALMAGTTGVGNLGSGDQYLFGVPQPNGGAVFGTQATVSRIVGNALVHASANSLPDNHCAFAALDLAAGDGVDELVGACPEGATTCFYTANIGVTANGISISDWVSTRTCTAVPATELVGAVAAGHRLVAAVQSGTDRALVAFDGSDFAVTTYPFEATVPFLAGRMNSDATVDLVLTDSNGKPHLLTGNTDGTFSLAASASGVGVAIDALLLRRETDIRDLWWVNSGRKAVRLINDGMGNFQ